MSVDFIAVNTVLIRNEQSYKYLYCMYHVKKTL